MTWSQESLEGCYRFLKRVWKLGDKVVGEGFGGDEGDGGVKRKLNQTIKKVGEDVSAMKFNTAIAAMMELLNELDKKESLDKAVLQDFLLILAPFAPHITEELWEKTGKEFSIHQQLWPEYDPDLTGEETVTIAVQVNGRLRSTIQMQNAKCKMQNEVEKMAKEDEKVKKYLEGYQIKRTIYIPGRLINFVI